MNELFFLFFFAEEFLGIIVDLDPARLPKFAGFIISWRVKPKNKPWRIIFIQSNRCFDKIFSVKLIDFFVFNFREVGILFGFADVAYLTAEVAHGKEASA